MSHPFCAFDIIHPHLPIQEPTSKLVHEFFWKVSEPDFELAGGSYKFLHDYEEEEKLRG